MHCKCGRKDYSPEQVCGECRALLRDRFKRTLSTEFPLMSASLLEVMATRLLGDVLYWYTEEFADE